MNGAGIYVTDDWPSQYFDAMEIVAKTSMQDGQMLYGKKFYNFEE